MLKFLILLNVLILMHLHQTKIFFVDFFVEFSHVELVIYYIDKFNKLKNILKDRGWLEEFLF